MQNEAFLANMKEKLLEEKGRVEKKIADLTAPEQQLVNPQWDETANDAIEDVQQESLLRIYRGLEEKVNAALQRIEDKTYGTCPQCDADVPQELLEAEPWADRCGAICASKS